MPAAAQFGQNFPHIDFSQTAAADDEDALLHLGQGKQDLDIFHIHKFVGQDGEIADILRGGGPGQDDFDAAEVDGGGVADEIVQEGHLFRG